MNDIKKKIESIVGMLPFCLNDRAMYDNVIDELSTLYTEMVEGELHKFIGQEREINNREFDAVWWHEIEGNMDNLTDNPEYIKERVWNWFSEHLSKAEKRAGYKAIHAYIDWLPQTLTAPRGIKQLKALADEYIKFYSNDTPKPKQYLLERKKK